MLDDFADGSVHHRRQDAQAASAFLQPRKAVDSNPKATVALEYTYDRFQATSCLGPTVRLPRAYESLSTRQTIMNATQLAGIGYKVARGVATMNYIVPPRELMFDDLNAVPNYISKSIPYFFLFMLVEELVARLRGRSVFRFNDTVASVNLGVVQQLFMSWFRFLTIGVYVYLYDHCRVATIPHDSLLSYAGLLLGMDWGYYWFHRTAHTYHIMWAAHSVHHSGEDYNMATALRQGAAQGLSGFLFYLPLALIGFHPASFIAHKQLNTLYQYWIHTTVVGHLGFLERFLNTPSHHRMHHRPPGNRNYAAVLIIWDRMHGTFVPEDEQKDFYGLAKQYATFDPLWANAEHPRRVVANVGAGDANKSGGGLWRWLRLPFRRRVKHRFVFKPWVLLRPLPRPRAPKGLGRPLRSTWVLPPRGKSTRPKYDGAGGALPLAVNFYVGLNWLLLLVGVLVYLLNAKRMAARDAAWLCAYLVTAAQSCGLLCDGVPAGRRYEWWRLFFVAAFVALNGGALPTARVAGATATARGGVAALAAVWALVDLWLAPLAIAAKKRD